MFESVVQPVENRIDELVCWTSEPESVAPVTQAPTFPAKSRARTRKRYVLPLAKLVSRVGEATPVRRVVYALPDTLTARS